MDDILAQTGRPDIARGHLVRDIPLGRLGDVEPAGGIERGADHVGPVRTLERRLEPRRLDLVLGVVAPVPFRREDPHASESSSSRYCSRHLARCSLPDDVFGSDPGWTSITSRGGRPHTSSVR